MLLEWVTQAPQTRGAEVESEGKFRLNTFERAATGPEAAAGALLRERGDTGRGENEWMGEREVGGRTRAGQRGKAEMVQFCPCDIVVVAFCFGAS